MKLTGIFDIDMTVMSALDDNVSVTSKALNAVPGISSGPMGLTPAHVKATPEFQKASKAFEAAEFAYRRPFLKMHRTAWDAECRRRAALRRA